ncbi:MAG: hypothetical protein M0C28_16480 [Candidatus Moduliflexus flocculans]|nr:hypothetical protein [Candidatus Moduliflexus flocculans]
MRLLNIYCAERRRERRRVLIDAAVHASRVAPDSPARHAGARPGVSEQPAVQRRAEARRARRCGASGRSCAGGPLTASRRPSPRPSSSKQHGYPPLVLSFESIDKLEHVLFVYKRRGRWGSVGRSRDPGLHGRKPVFRTARDLAMSYFEPYVDLTGGITAYAVVDLDKELGRVRLAAVGEERLESRADAHRLSAPSRCPTTARAPHGGGDGTGRSRRAIPTASPSATRAANAGRALPPEYTQTRHTRWRFPRPGGFSRGRSRASAW